MKRWTNKSCLVFPSASDQLSQNTPLVQVANPNKISSKRQAEGNPRSFLSRREFVHPITQRNRKNREKGSKARFRVKVDRLFISFSRWYMIADTLTFHQMPTNVHPASNQRISLLMFCGHTSIYVLVKCTTKCSRSIGV